MCVQSLQSCLFDPMDYSPLGSSVHGDSLGKNTGVGSHVLPPPGDLPNPGIESVSLTSPAMAGRFLFFFFYH